MNKHSEINSIMFSTKNEAHIVIDKLNKIMDTYGTVSVSDLRFLSGLIYTGSDNKYGWTDISSVKVVKNGNKFRLQIEEPKKFK